MSKIINSINKDILYSNVQYIKGVGPRKAKLLEDIGISTVIDLLYYFPRDWLDRRLLDQDFNFKIGEDVTLLGIVESIDLVNTRNTLIFKAVIKSSKSRITAFWFRKKSYKYDVLESLKKNITKGQEVIVSGIVDFNGLKVKEHEIPSETLLHTGKIIPVYSANHYITSKFLRSLIGKVLTDAIESIDEFLPENVIKNNDLMPLMLALKNIHFPDTWEEKNKAYIRLVFDELFLFFLLIFKNKKQNSKIIKKHLYEVNRKILKPFKENISFSMTSSQKHVINEIFNDLLSSKPMNRLLQGDVGSGKTIVAISALLLAVENGHQTVMMVPTEVLARQHYDNISKLTENLDVKLGLFTGSMTNKQKQEMLRQIEAGNKDIIVGTHALLSDKLKMPKLSLIVIDEQHKFGVYQRLKIRERNSLPDVLVMSATPIPRTLALTAYGDLDISTISGLPLGRKKILTEITDNRTAFSKLTEELLTGHQGYIVYPVIDKDNKLELKAAEDMYKKLKSREFKDFNIGLIHGKMKDLEKENIMRLFRNNEIQVLITTTVIEVGINVKNATVMIIEHPERFGLATLHQLRGRVGRSQIQSYCFLIQKNKDIKRLNVLVRFNDGFSLAEEDLGLRGPGDFLGSKQHGYFKLRIGDIVRDKEIVNISRDEALNVVYNPDFNSIYNEVLRKLHKKHRIKSQVLYT